jgi:hypothetical protein
VINYESLVLAFGIKIGPHLSITAGPALTWIEKSSNTPLPKPVFALYSHEINERNSLSIGARAAVRFQF